MQTGDKFPDLLGVDSEGKEVRLSDYPGKKFVLYFYPKDNTPGCSKQAANFAEHFPKFQEEDIVILGISKDSEASHQKFAEKYNLPFILLSDPDLKAIKNYDVWQEKKLYGKVSMGIVRTTYVIDEKGMIEKVFEKVKAAQNAEDVLEYLG